ncbi:MAG TPA: hypothetical protein VL134_12215 [Leptolyngbya sp.]|jgi:hypothetical protein|nr:hypothetical protein [Leptolyngbya sp.]
MSNPFSPRQTRRSRFLKVSEYTSAAVSVIGVVVSAVTQQAIYATAPLSLSLCLNLVNRRRFEQQTEQRLNGTIAQLDQQLRALPIPSEADLSQRFAQLQAQLTVTTDQTEVRSQLAQLIEQLTTFRQQQDAATAALTELQAQISQLDAQFASMQQRQNDAVDQAGLAAQISQVREQVREQVLQEIETVRQQIEIVHQQIQAVSNSDSAATLQANLSRLEEQILQLQVQLRTIEARQTIEPPPAIETQTGTELEPRPETEIVPQPPDILSDEANDLDVLALNLGIDFGTSFTKVCFRNLANDRSEIVTFSDEVTHLAEALLPTTIAILPDGTLVAGLTASEWQHHQSPDQTIVEFIKMRLAAFDLPQSSGSWQLEKIPGVSQAEAIEDLCAYYLSRVIVRAQAWIRRNKPELLVNQKIQWSANVGVPVEYCDSKAIDRFRKVLSLAWLLSNEPQTEALTVQNLHDQLKPLRSTLQQAAIDCHAVPEIAAEIWSLINSREADTGFYVLFDIGDGTLDGCSFRYWNDEGEKKVDFYSGKVNPLGVTAFSQVLAKELGVAEHDIKLTICGDSTRYVDRAKTSTARNQIQTLVATVVYQGTQKYREHGFKVVQHTSNKPLDVRIAGGGGQTSFYQEAICSTHQARQHNDYGIPTYQPGSLPIPKDLETNGIDQREFHRFAVAYGLSIPPGEQPDVRLPSEMEPIQPTSSMQKDPLGKPPSYEEMRGS